MKLLFVLAYSGGEMGGPLDVNPGLILWTVVTFVVLMFVLKKMAWGPILTALSEREKKIEDSLTEAEKAKKETEKLILENKEAILKAEEEARRILTQTREDAENLKNKILEESNQKAKKMIDDAVNEIERKNHEAFITLKSQIAEISISAAEKILRENLDSEKSKALVNKYIEDISKN